MIAGMSERAIGPECFRCRHIRSNYTCAAFTQGMPREIIEGFDHREPLEGDSGIRFDPREPGEPAPVFDSLDLLEDEAVFALYLEKFGKEFRHPPIGHPAWSKGWPEFVARAKRAIKRGTPAKWSGWHCDPEKDY